MSLISLFYSIIILIYLAIGAAIVFHMLYYKINRRVATIMFFIYVVGGILLLISNYSLYRSVSWYNIFSGTGF
jgi:ABC-type glycerol-3-phosphate transport system permease component